MIGMVLAGLALLGGAPKVLTQADVGPAPTWQQATALGEAAIRAQLIDPDSAKIEWPYQFTAGTLKALLGKTRAGYWTCGFVNSKNRMGGYAGKGWFLVMIRDGAVTSLTIAEPDGFDAATATCPGAVKKGLLSPAPVTTQAASAARPTGALDPAAFAAAASQSAARAASNGGIGIAYEPTQFGAMIASVAPGSAAERAGIKPGETIEALNGISLKGMSATAMMEVLRSAPDAVTVQIVGVGAVKVR